MAVCERCQKSFTPKRPDRTTGRWCSVFCANTRGGRQERFDAHVPDRPVGDCWLWAGTREARGYGVTSFMKRNVLAHRLSWELSHGAIPAGLHVLHRCDNPPCVNPGHLFLGTHLDNIADMVGKGRHVRGERQWQSVLTEDAVRSIRAAGESGRELARRFGVTASCISEVRNGKAWAHVGVTA